MWIRIFGIFLLLFGPSYFSFSQPPQISSLLEEIKIEAESIREESQQLKILLMLSEAELTESKFRLQKVDQELIKVLGNLEKSEAELIVIKSELDRLKFELIELKKAVIESQKLSKKLKTQNTFWKILAISGLAVGAAGLVVILIN